MKKNIGGFDRLARIMLAAVFAFLYFSATVTGGVGVLLLVIAAVFLLTSFVGFCPLYTLFGWNTCATKKP